MNNLNICFFGSSEFVIPILNNIHESKDIPLESIFNQQLTWLEENQNILTEIFPEDFIANLRNLDLNSEFFRKTPNLKLVITQPDRLNRDKLIANPVSIFCLENNILTFKPEKINLEVEEFVKLAQAFDVGITASFGQIVSQKVLDSAKYGFINWHPSLLPLYRGPTPIQTAILNGEKEIGLSWIEMTKKMDAGQIYLQLKYNLEITETFTNVTQKMALLGSNTWLLVLCSKIFSLPNIIQDENKVTFTKMLTKEDKYVDVKINTALEIYSHFKSYIQTPFTVYKDEYFAQEVKILDCQLYSLDEKSKPIVNYENSSWMQLKHHKTTINLLKCKDSYLRVNIIQLENGKRVHLAGYRFREGQH